MEHPIYRVCDFRVVDDYVLSVTFDDGTEQTIDFRPVLAGKLLGPLRDLALFNQVRIDREVHTLVCPNGADFDPATLHDWPDHVDALQALAMLGNGSRSPRNLCGHRRKFVLITHRNPGQLRVLKVGHGPRSQRFKIS